MKKKVIVVSLGGSLIVPEQIDFVFLDKFKKSIKKFYKGYKFVIVCGGGTIARKYISALAYENKSEKELSLAGIRATRMNALFLMQFFGKEANSILPKDMKSVESNLHKNNVVICGALRFEEHSTSDSTAARLASHLKSDFINMTNIKGLYTKDPRTDPSATFIPSISWEEFEKKANAIEHHPGQHFVLDQKASTLIRQHRIKTYIIGKDLKNLENFLKGKSFQGTSIAQ